MSLESFQQNTSSEKFQFCGRGTVWSFTTTDQVPTYFEEFVPITFSIIELDEGPLMTAQLTDLGDQKPFIGSLHLLHNKLSIKTEISFIFILVHCSLSLS